MNTRNIGNEAKINPKTGRIDQACERYGVGRSTMRRIAEESGAVVRVGRTYLINYSTDYFEEGHDERSTDETRHKRQKPV